MKDTAVKQILQSHELRITPCRTELLDFFSKDKRAYSIPELEAVFAHFDRVTLYRTIAVFEEKGILHAVPDLNGVAKYGSCFETCKPGVHEHRHLHFKCSDCGEINCLDVDMELKPVLPGYIVKDVQMIVSGICKTCNLN